MNWFRADLHIHSVLSPCGDLDMSPVRIIDEAKRKKLDIIAITDHNATQHSALMMELGIKNDITVFPGVEVNTKEEVHCLAFFEDLIAVQKFQEYIDQKLPVIKINSQKFGIQLVVNEKEEILQEIDKLLIIALEASIEEIEKQVHLLGGVFIPAHIDRMMNGLYSQIGFIPKNLHADALEISNFKNFKQTDTRKYDLDNYAVISNSDAHMLENIGSKYTSYYLAEPTFKEWKLALQQTAGRKINCE